MLWLPSLTSAFAAVRAITERIDMGKRQWEPLPCEGKCSHERVTATTHNLLRETWDKDLEGFRVDYQCSICENVRQYGLNECRETTKGVSN